MKNPYNPITEPASTKWYLETQQRMMELAEKYKMEEEPVEQLNTKVTELNKDELVELGFKPTDAIGWALYTGSFAIEIDSEGIMICLGYSWYDTTAKTIQDIKDLIRLFK